MRQLPPRPTEWRHGSCHPLLVDKRHEPCILLLEPCRGRLQRSNSFVHFLLNQLANLGSVEGTRDE